jgi:hypothetical protein
MGIGVEHVLIALVYSRNKFPTTPISFHFHVGVYATLVVELKPVWEGSFPTFTTTSEPSQVAEQSLQKMPERWLEAQVSVQNIAYECAKRRSARVKRMAGTTGWNLGLCRKETMRLPLP